MTTWEFCSIWFFTRTFVEFSITLRMWRLGVGLRFHPMSVSLSVALVIFNVTVGFTREPKRKADVSTLRRKADGFIKHNAA